jgi:hypothetical protein
MRSEPEILKVLPTPICEEAEPYFIQFWFCVNRDVLRAAFLDLYDEFFKVYLRIIRKISTSDLVESLPQVFRESSAIAGKETETGDVKEWRGLTTSPRAGVVL